jgi:hypothetical protein
MSKLRFVPACGLLLLVAALMLACGINHGLYKSLTVSPATADAQDFPNGQVQFTATATEINGTQVSPASALWTPGPPWSLGPLMPWPAIQLDQTGKASCGAAGPGTYMIAATAPIDPHSPVSKMTMNTPQVSGAAMLTCP